MISIGVAHRAAHRLDLGHVLLHRPRVQPQLDRAIAPLAKGKRVLGARGA
jgi:hypothetical protein